MCFAKQDGIKKPPLCKGRGTALAVEGLSENDRFSFYNPSVIFAK